MALKIMYRLLVAQNAKRPTDANIKVFDMEADTIENRNAALLALGWPNNSGEEPITTKRKFLKKMLKDHSIEKITVIPVLIDDITGNSYELREIESEDYSNLVLNRKSKEVKARERKLWLKDVKDIELDLKENYEIREGNDESISASSTSVSGQ